VSGTGKASNRLVTEELRLSSPSGSQIEYTAGLFFSTQKGINPPGPLDIFIHVPYPGPNIILAHPVTSDGGLTNIYDDSMAIFGQTTIHLGDHLRLIAGARYTGERLAADTTPVATGVLARGHSNIENFSWKLGAQYEFNRNIQAYATVARGYKGPQLVLPDPSLPNGKVSVIQPEVPTDYEAGLKATFAGGRVATDLSVFWIDLKDYQGQQCSPLAGGLGLRCVPQNISKVKSRGVEFNISGQPFHGLSLNGGVIYNPVTYPKGFLANDLYPYGVATTPADLGGLQLANAPRWKFTASGEYSHALAGPVEGFIAADAVYKGHFRAATSIDPALIYPAHWTLGGRVGVRDASGRWTAAIFARNLGRNREPVIRYASFPANPGDYGQILTPQAFRQIGLSLDGSF
jgi:iron complex outermembrane receptor protein